MYLKVLAFYNKVSVFVPLHRDLGPAINTALHGDVLFLKCQGVFRFLDELRGHGDVEDGGGVDGVLGVLGPALVGALVAHMDVADLMRARWCWPLTQ